MSYRYLSLPGQAKNLVYVGGTMAFVTPGMDADELTANFKDQIDHFCAAWEVQGGDADELTFVVGFNSQASVDALNNMGENITLAANDEERIAFFEQFAKDIGAQGILSFDAPKLGELFARQTDAGQPFAGIVKRGYTPNGEDGLPICDGMQWVLVEGGLALTLPNWAVGGETVIPATTKSHTA